MPFHREQVAGVPFGVTNLTEAVEWLLATAATRKGIAVRLANAYCIALSSKDVDYRRILTGEGVNLPDGTPVVWALRRKRLDGDLRAQRVRGPSFFVSALDRSQSRDLSHYFLGATDETLAALAKQIESRFPDVRIAGYYSPPFGELDADFYRISESKIKKAEPDIVWIGLGTPKQDFAAHRLAQSLGIPCVGVGAAFDFVAGTVSEAPLWVQNSGFEWLFRLLSEPRRLWRRYLFGNFRFLIEVAKGSK